MLNETPDIKELLDKNGEVKLKAKAGKFSLIKNDGHFYYSVNGFMVGISGQKLDELLKMLPPNVGIIGLESK
jgi:hypothetical protein